MSERTSKPLARDNYEEGKQVGCTVGSTRPINGNKGYETEMNPAIILFDFKTLFQQIEALELKKKKITSENLPEYVIINTVQPAKSHGRKLTADNGLEIGE